MRKPFLAPEELKSAKGSATIESEPLGVWLGVEPWNCPHHQTACFAAPNLMAGNVVMVKKGPQSAAVRMGHLHN